MFDRRPRDGTWGDYLEMPGVLYLFRRHVVAGTLRFFLVASGKLGRDRLILIPGYEYLRNADG